jgi:hypothetical protein
MKSIMKKIFYFAIISLAGALMVSCEPSLIEGPTADAPIAGSELQSGFVIDGQFADAACTIAQPDGNYIKYHTSPARTVQVSNTKADGSKNILATGASGVFNITPRRGADSNQPFSVSTINQDASVVSFDSSVNVYVPADLAPEVKVLTGESGAKAWKWYAINGAAWGNAGYIAADGHGANVAAGEIPGFWWGCVPEDLETEQIAHSGGTVYGYGDSNAYMVFNEDGECISYKADGTQIAKGTYTLQNYDPACSDGYHYGTLVTTDAPILFPFMVNKGGMRVNEFDVIYIDPNMMSLVCGNGQDAWSWGEATWWRFKNASDPDAALAGSGERAWTYYPIDGSTWGNAGYIGVGGQANVAAGEIPGFWWGCLPEQLETEQISHSGGVAYGYGSDDAYMVFDNANGVVTSYDASGSKIASSSYSIENFDWTTASNDDYKMGDLKTDAAESGILFPFIINTGGQKATDYEILYVDGTLLTLICRNGQDVWGWGECTWWRFQPKK